LFNTRQLSQRRLGLYICEQFVSVASSVAGKVGGICVVSKVVTVNIGLLYSTELVGHCCIALCHSTTQREESMHAVAFLVTESVGKKLY